MSVEAPQQERQRNEHLPRRSRLVNPLVNKASLVEPPPACIIQGFWWRSTLTALIKLHHLILWQNSQTHDQEPGRRCSRGFVSSIAPSDGFMRCRESARTQTHKRDLKPQKEGFHLFFPLIDQFSFVFITKVIVFSSQDPSDFRMSIHIFFLK